MEGEKKFGTLFSKYYNRDLEIRRYLDLSICLSIFNKDNLSVLVLCSNLSKSLCLSTKNSSPIVVSSWLFCKKVATLFCSPFKIKRNDLQKCRAYKQ